MPEKYRSPLTAEHHNYLVSYINRDGKFASLKIRTALPMDKGNAAVVLACMAPPTLDAAKLPDCVVRVQEITGGDVSPSFDDLLVRHSSPAGDYFDLPSELTPYAISSGGKSIVLLAPTAPSDEDGRKFLRRLLADALASACRKDPSRTTFSDLDALDDAGRAVLARFGIIFPYGQTAIDIAAFPEDRILPKE